MSDKHQKQQDEQNQIIREAVAFSASTYTFQLISLVRGLIIIQVLSPALYGVWSIFKTFLQSSSYLSLGTYQAMLREVPFHEGQGEPESGQRVKQNALAWCLLLSSIAGIVTWIFSFTPAASDYRFEIRLSSLVYVLYAIYIFIVFQLKSDRKIFLLSRIYLIYATLNAVFGIALVLVFGITGLLLGMAISTGIIIYGLVKRNHLSFNLQLQRSTIIHLIDIGLPVLLVAAMAQLMTSIDKLVIFIMLGSVETGYFSLASFFSEIINYLPYAITTVLFPRMVYRLGQNKSASELEHFYTKPLFLLSGIIPILLGLIFINIDLLITYAMPKYEPAIDVLRILVLALFFAVVWTMPKNIIVAFNKQKILMKLIPVFLLVGALIDVYMIKLGYGITGVAFGSALVLFAISLITNLFALSILEKTAGEKLVVLIKTYLPFVYVLLGLAIVFQVSTSNEQSIVTAVLRSSLFCLFCVPLIIYINKQSGIIEKVFTAFGRKG